MGAANTTDASLSRPTARTPANRDRETQDLANSLSTIEVEWPTADVPAPLRMPVRVTHDVKGLPKRSIRKIRQDETASKSSMERSLPMAHSLTNGSLSRPPMTQSSGDQLSMHSTSTKESARGHLTNLEDDDLAAAAAEREAEAAAEEEARLERKKQSQAELKAENEAEAQKAEVEAEIARKMAARDKWRQSAGGLATAAALVRMSTRNRDGEHAKDVPIVHPEAAAGNNGPDADAHPRAPVRSRRITFRMSRSISTSSSRHDHE